MAGSNRGFAAPALAHRCGRWALRASRFALAFVPLILAGCSSLGASRHHDLCHEMAKFANSLPDNAPRSVVLETTWLGDPSKKCSYGGYAPGSVFCQWLNHNTVTEFAEFNFRDALACLRGPAGDSRLVAPVFDKFEVKVKSLDVKHADKNVGITLEYSSGEGLSPSKLTITAQRWDSG